MIKNRYNIPINNEDYIKFLELLKNNVYKILCLREENNTEEQNKAIKTVILKMKGIYSLFYNKINFLEIIARLEGLLLSKKVSIKFFRKTVFEVLNLIDTEIRLLKEVQTKD